MSYQVIMKDNPDLSVLFMGTIQKHSQSCSKPVYNYIGYCYDKVIIVYINQVTIRIIILNFTKLLVMV